MFYNHINIIIAERCAPGSEYNKTSGKCEKCAPGYYKKGNLTSSRDRCLPCGPNTLVKKSGQAECTGTVNLSKNRIKTI